MASTCVAPGKAGELCGLAATEERTVAGVVMDLCTRHAAELDGEPQTGRAVHPIVSRPRTSDERATLVAAAKAAHVSLSYYLLESALMVAAEEGFTPPSRPAKWPIWSPKKRAKKG